MLNTIIGNYRVVRYVNSGGVADIYEGIDMYNAHQVALKVLKPEYINDAQLKERFYREARILANISHPSIVKILFASMHQTYPVMAMEFLQGEDLNCCLKKEGALPIEIVQSFFLQILDAIGYAHANSVLHRDIKPSNIFITNDKRIKVLDFGIAKVIGLSFDATGTGSTMGTPAYMSPEQVKADKRIDERSDIYSLGVTLYTMLVGQNPYHHIKSHYEIYQKVANEPLPFISQYPVLSAVINKATQKEKDNRYQSIEEFKNDFTSALVKHHQRNNYVANLSNKKLKKQLAVYLTSAAVLVSFFLIGLNWNKIKNVFPEKAAVEKKKGPEETTANNNPEVGVENNIPTVDGTNEDNKSIDPNRIPTSDPEIIRKSEDKISRSEKSYDTVRPIDSPKSKAPDDF
jgi:serine/threonine protein kinase